MKKQSRIRTYTRKQKRKKQKITKDLVINKILIISAQVS